MSSAVAKVVVLAFSGAIAVVTTHVILSRYGVEAYAQYGLLASLSALLPFTDLGMSVVVLNAVSTSTDVRRDALLRARLTSVLRVLLASALVLVVLGSLVQWSGGWPRLLGEGLDPGRGGDVALMCLAVFAVAMPFGVGQRILIGLGRNHVQVLLSGLAAPLILLGTLGLLRLGPSAMAFVAVLPYVAIAVVAVLTFALAWRGISPQLGAAVRDVPRLRSVPGTPVMNLAWPSLVQLIAVPLALQSDRVLLSHLGTTLELAAYGLAAQLFGLVLQTINTAGISLWPIFARAREDGRILAPYRASAAFAGAAGLVAGVLAAL
ncbi:MAG TPA: polysaccharide biosynthesis protein, partial [Actinomycetales bacterium]